MKPTVKLKDREAQLQALAEKAKKIEADLKRVNRKLDEVEKALEAREERNRKK